MYIKRKAILLIDVVLTICLVMILFYVTDLSLKNYYSAQYDQRKIQCEILDGALEGYGSKHLAIKTIEHDAEGKEKIVYQKTYPKDINELEKTGYVKLLSDDDMKLFKYIPKEETTYGDIKNITYYELKVKIPNTNTYYTSPGSDRSKYIANN